MDKFEYKLRADEIRNLIAEHKYREAVDVADTIDWRNVKNSNMLCTVSDLYKKCRRFEDARDVLLLAYQRNPGGKLIVYSLCELSIKLDDTYSAVEFLKEYIQLAPRDTGRYILQYKLLEAQGAGLEERIAILEELQKRECKERWMYELAYLYHRVGLNTQCIEQCNQVVIFFGEGNYVVKALELKSLHEPLDFDQQALYNRLTAPEEEEIIIPDVYDTVDLQKELAGSVLDIMALNNEAESQNVKPEQDIADTDNEPEAPEKEETAADDEVIPETADDLIGNTQVIPVVAPTVDESEENLADTQVIPVISEEQLGDTQVIPSIPKEVVEDIQTDSEETSGETKVISVEKILDEIKENEEDLGDTKFVSDEEMQEIKEATAENKPAPSDPDVVEYTPGLFDKKEDKSDDDISKDETSVNSDDDGQLSMFEDTDTVSLSDTIVVPRKVIEDALGGSKVEIDDTEEKSEFSAVNFDDMLKLEGDGQISLVVPEQQMIEKQITGQICIDEVLLDYERTRQENEERWTAGVSSSVKRKYDDILKEFDETKDEGYLRELEESIENNPETVIIESETNTDEEVIIVDENNEEASLEEVVNDETTVDEGDGEKEPTKEELTFDRTPFVSTDENENTVEEIEEPSDGGEPYESSSLTDYLEKFAQNSEERDSVEQGDLSEQEAVTPEQEEMSEQEALEMLKHLDDGTEDPFAIAARINREKAAVDEADDTKTLGGEEKEAEEPSAEEEGTTEQSPETTDVDEEDGSEKETSTDEDTDASENSSEESANENTESSETVENTDSELPDHEGFTDSQWTRLESFVLTEKPREQIKEAIPKLSHFANTGNVIISSVDVDSAIELSKALAHEESLKDVLSHKVYMIKASSLNAKDVEATFDKVIDQALVIQDAEELRKETLETMKRVMSDPERTMLVFLAVSHRQKARFIKENEELLELFNIQIDIEALDNSELVNLAKKYAYKREFSINEMGTLALHRRIEERQTNSHSVLFSEVREIVDEAISHASKKNIPYFFDVIFGKKRDDNDMIILGEKDFTE